MQEKSPYLDSILNNLQQEGHQTSIVRADYELQKGGNEMLVIQKA